MHLGPSVKKGTGGDGEEIFKEYATHLADVRLPAGELIRVGRALVRDVGHTAGLAVVRDVLEVVVLNALVRRVLPRLVPQAPLGERSVRVSGWAVSSLQYVVEMIAPGTLGDYLQNERCLVFNSSQRSFAWILKSLCARVRVSGPEVVVLHVVCVCL